MTKKDLTFLMTKSAALALFTCALLSIPKLLGSLLTIMSIFLIGLGKETLTEKIVSTWYLTQFSEAVAHFATFGVLLFLARWMFKGPKCIERWMAEESDSALPK
jgi:hypothetical protein